MSHSRFYHRRGQHTPTLTPAISLAADDATVSAAQGGSVAINLTVTRSGGFTGTVALAVTGLPTGVTGSFSDSSLSSGETTSVLTLTVSGGAGIVTNDAFVISATGTGVSQSDVNGTVTVTAAAGNPTPSGTIILDTRSGGNADMQAQTTYAGAKSAIGAILTRGFIGQAAAAGNNAYGWNFVTDFDGSGTNAFRSDMPGWGDHSELSYVKTQADNGNKFDAYLPTALPAELYVQWKTWMGRTATGGGFDDIVQSGGVDRSSRVGEFAVVNDELYNTNASRKYLLVPRDVTDGGGCGRYDIIWPGSSTTGTAGTGTVSISYTAGSDSGTATFSSSQSSLTNRLLVVGSNRELWKITGGSGTSWTIASLYGKGRLSATLTAQSFVLTDERTTTIQANSNYAGTCAAIGFPADAITVGQLSGVSFRMEKALNQLVTFTTYFKVSSSISAADGVVRVWANGELILESTAVNHGNMAIDRLEVFGGTYNSPRFSQTEYFWDLVLWKP